MNAHGTVRVRDSHVKLAPVATLGVARAILTKRDIYQC